MVIKKMRLYLLDKNIKKKQRIRVELKEVGKKGEFIYADQLTEFLYNLEKGKK